MSSLWLVFATGLFTGGLSCLAVQGGLLASLIAQRQTAENDRKRVDSKQQTAFPIAIFLLAKLVAYSILGFLLGWFGSFFQLSIGFQVGLMIFVAVYMLGSALALLDVHPIFRYFLITPPRFLTRLVRKQSKSRDFFAPALLGALTIFVPCGTTQAMMALAVASGNPILGALTLGVFVLGTSPVFFALGYSASRLSDQHQGHFRRVTAFVVIALALWNLNSAAVLSGSSVSLQSIVKSINCTISFCSESTSLAQAGSATTTTQPTIHILRTGYSVDRPLIKAGSKIRLRIVNTGGTGCQQSLIIPSLGIQKLVPNGQEATVEFTAPTKPGTLAFSCSMGMYRGEMQVVSG